MVISMKPLKTKISITLDDPVLEQTKRLAEREDRSLSSYINLLLKAHLERMEKTGLTGRKTVNSLDNGEKLSYNTLQSKDRE